MRSSIGRNLWLLGVLLQGVHSVKAEKLIYFQPSLIANSPISALAGAKRPPQTSRVNLPRAIELKGSRPRLKLSSVKPAEPQLNKDLLTLRSPANLALPNDSSQVQVKELAPLFFEDVLQLVEVNSPTLKAASLQVDQAKFLLKAALSAWYPRINLAANGKFGVTYFSFKMRSPILDPSIF